MHAKCDHCALWLAVEYAEWQASESTPWIWWCANCVISSWYRDALYAWHTGATATSLLDAADRSAAMPQWQGQDRRKPVYPPFALHPLKVFVKSSAHGLEKTGRLTQRRRAGCGSQVSISQRLAPGDKNASPVWADHLPVYGYAKTPVPSSPKRRVNCRLATRSQLQGPEPMRWRRGASERRQESPLWVDGLSRTPNVLVAHDEHACQPSDGHLR